MTAVSSLCVLEKNFKEMEFRNLQMKKLVYVSGMNWISFLYRSEEVKGIISHNALLKHMSQPIIKTALLRHF